MSRTARRVSTLAKIIAVPAALLASGTFVSIASQSASASTPSSYTVADQSGDTRSDAASHTLAASSDDTQTATVSFTW